LAQVCSVLIANQVVGEAKLERLVALAPRTRELIVAVDSAPQVAALDRALARAGSGVRVGARDASHWRAPR
jgi:D-serine deaminase-like pyridoxal phosphate-dependent protein